LRSPLVQQVVSNTKQKLTSAAHTGYPNGDQPFYILLKVPRNSTEIDWQGKHYIFFNSAYVATRRSSWFRDFGYIGLLVKTPLWLINPHWWTKVEEDLVGTTYPFKWEVKAAHAKDQVDMLKAPNVLGGRIWLDEMDKIKYSEVSGMIEAENQFIQLTRQAQSQDVSGVLDSIQSEDPKFRKNLRTDLINHLNEQQSALTNQQSLMPPKH
jgi:hypothetical protein